MAKKKIFFDLEFTGLHKLTTPISIGLVSEEGDKFYAEFTDYDKFQIDKFLKSEVLSKLILNDYNFEKDYKPDEKEVFVKGDIDLIYSTMNAWLIQFEDEGVEMWGDVLAYDWVLFINIFGNGLALPKFIDYIPVDLSTVLAEHGIHKDVNRDEFAYGEEIANSRKDKKHNSLHDAETQLAVYKKLIEMNHDKEDVEVEDSEVQLDEAKSLSNDVIETSKEDVQSEEPIEVLEVEEKEVPLEDETFIQEHESKPSKKKKRGRPKKEENSTFVEPTQSDVNSTEEWNTPI